MQKEWLIMSYMYVDIILKCFRRHRSTIIFTIPAHLYSQTTDFNPEEGSRNFPCEVINHLQDYMML